VLFAVMCGGVRAEVVLPPLFSDGLVLQAGSKAPVWGKADPGEKVTVTIAGQSRNAMADAQGKWRVDLENLEAGGPLGMTVAGKNTLTIRNVLVGEVWLASGQSNMEYPLAAWHVRNGDAEVAAANYPLIHVFTVKTKVAPAPLEEAEGSWQVCTPTNAPSFSATGYFFARDLHKAIGKPVGLIHSSVSGTLAEAWTSTEVLKGEPDFAAIFQRYDDAVAAYPKALQDYKDKLAAWEKAAATAKEANEKPPAKPAEPRDPATATTRPGGLFNGKIAPLIPFGFRGAIWWQGEFNSERGEQYAKLFPALIRDWRRRWAQGDFPFLFVQLQNLDIQPQPNKAHYDEMRDAQLMTLRSVTNTGMAVACDVGDANNIHPPNKQVIGGRLALIARATVYGEKELEYSGPLYQGMKVDGGLIRLSFTHLGGGLTVKNGGGDVSLPWRAGGPPVGSRAKPALDSFVIAGADRKFVKAEAKIDGDAVLVCSPEVKQPVAVRYAWADNPVCTLYNQAGLPASPFRTDDWPVFSTGKR